MKNIKKIIFGLFLFTFMLVNVEAAGIKESGADYENDVIIIGSTRFSAETIITVEKAAQAGVNEALLALIRNENIEDVEIDVHYYSVDYGKWHEVTEAGINPVPLSATEAAEFESNLNIFFEENEEKKLYVPFDGTVDKDSIENMYGTVTYNEETKQFEVSSTALYFGFTTNGSWVEVSTKYDEEVGEEEDGNQYGEFEVIIPPIIGFKDLPAEAPTNSLSKPYEFSLDIKGNTYANKPVDIAFSIADGAVLEYYNGSEWVESVTEDNMKVFKNITLVDGEYKFRISSTMLGYYSFTAQLIHEESGIAYTDDSLSIYFEKATPELTLEIKDEVFNVTEPIEITLDLTANDYAGEETNVYAYIESLEAYDADIEMYNGTEWVAVDAMGLNDFSLENKQLKYRITFNTAGTYDLIYGIGIAGTPTTKQVSVVYNADTTNVEAINKGVYFKTFEEAVNAAMPGDTVTLLKNTSGNGVIIDKDITIDLGGFTYTIDGETVGSEGTETNGFQLLQGINAENNVWEKISDPIITKAVPLKYICVDNADNPSSILKSNIKCSERTDAFTITYASQWTCDGKTTVAEGTTCSATCNTGILNSEKTECGKCVSRGINNITFKNGKITSEKAKILIQNYSNLTLEGVELDGANLVEGHYVLSNNNGNTLIKDSTITAPEAGAAFDVYYWPSFGYGRVDVRVENSTINGVIEYAGEGGVDTILANTLLTIDDASMAKAEVEAPAGYEWAANEGKVTLVKATA